MCSIEWVSFALRCVCVYMAFLVPFNGPGGPVTLLSAIIGMYGAFRRPWGPVTLLSAIIGVFGNVIGIHNVVDSETSVGQFLAGVFSQEGD